MAADQYSQFYSPDPKLLVVPGSFAPAGTGAPTSVKGKGFTVARADVGVYTVTFDRVYPECFAVLASVQLATPDGSIINVGAISLSSRTVSLAAFDDTGSALEIAANANNRVNFIAFFRRD